VTMSFREGMAGVNSYRMLQNLPGSFRMKMRRISALKSSRECFIDINKGGTAGFRSLRDWSSGFHPFVFGAEFRKRNSNEMFLFTRRQLWQRKKW